ncbi:TetR/AcrR family transcriptional regulator [Sulfitobacter sp. F26169L]|uniref:TetR/AcrR family transcriptional regulator n=1 Tax=Sulfitobacter sp. F26169L TaxID=2996015 RepID=UPI002260FF16|nr:TetR/AcrR family transcriptional regulator [Sulfitobacter sp. F26169L]MCX7565243.1 TetR/AcrR family transcriptional regulator [Sulfitobacter sp. F26169L]
MKLPLREKRRQETAFQIQKATLELAMKDGLDGVTTEEIAAASGVSTRTFFNYYPNKEAAAIGHPPAFTEEQKDALRKAEGTLATDIKQLLDGHIEALSEKEDILRMVGKVLRSNEKARGILDGNLGAERRVLTQALCDRVSNRQTAASLANSVTSTIGAAIFLWEHEEDMTLGAALDVVWEGLIDASRLLSPSNEEEI